MKIHFCGAAGTTTGSQHLLEVNGCRILLDCGMYQGRREEAWHINKDFPYFSPAGVDAFCPTLILIIPAIFPI
jgi:metallo-beta-lactamase family protein